MTAVISASGMRHECVLFELKTHTNTHKHAFGKLDVYCIVTSVAREGKTEKERVSKRKIAGCIGMDVRFDAHSWFILFTTDLFLAFVP